ncbi:MAG TPA: efflux transporter outer membrane subunit [Geminicoccus sp.]|uniref:efflux transporter outer membrane subunit n=1 Tax=Geminicoccus sp. TaxID=2024832 RepID=UPI002CA06043|nr:efflux transporter outer membrane subunit [Geminicoccus sp.]HWL70973.1 efflux transporter outer membrane subunit [Geminicoccus sp.]
MRLLLVPVLVAGLTACDVSHRLVTSPTETGRQFAALPADAEQRWPEPDWWRAFGSDELDGLIHEVASDNLDLQAAAQRVVQAEAQTRISRAALFPSIDADAGVSRGRSSSNSQNRTRTSYSGSIAASYELDLAGGLRDLAEASQLRLLGSSFDRDALGLILTADTADAYFTLLALRDRLALARDTLEASRRVLGIVRVQAAAGQASDLEVQQQLSAVSSQEAAVAEFEGDAQRQANALATLLGRPPGELAVATAGLSALTLPPVIAGLPSELLRRRPDLVQAEAELAAAGYDAQAARAARFPIVALTASGGLQSDELGDLLRLDQAVWSLAGAAITPVFDAGRLEANEDQAVARFQELAASYSQAILNALQDVDDSLVLVETARRSFALRQAAYRAASEAYRIAELRWRTGAADFLSVLQAQQASISAADTLTQADLARFTASVSLYRALGGGWDAAPAEPLLARVQARAP